MKTIKEWLEELPDGYRELAFAKCFTCELNSPISSMHKALWNGVHWGQYPEFGFWDKLHQFYGGCALELPPLFGKVVKEKNTKGFGTYPRRFIEFSRK